MSKEYDLYLKEHTCNVGKGYLWMLDNLPDVVNSDLITPVEEDRILYYHDNSKQDRAEYNPYDAYFYGNNRSASVVTDYERAWLAHIHKNSHHWQHYILHCDDPAEGVKVLDMPYDCIIEMICDWWSFSWKTNDLTNIFVWYEGHKEYIMLSDNTRRTVEDILGRMKEVLEKEGLCNGSK